MLTFRIAARFSLVALTLALASAPAASAADAASPAFGVTPVVILEPRARGSRRTARNSRIHNAFRIHDEAENPRGVAPASVAVPRRALVRG